VTDKQLTTEELDSLLVRELSRMPRFSPSRSFEERVMARVRLPQPAPVVAFHRVSAWVRQPRRALALAGAYAASMILALGWFVPWLVSNSAGVRFALDWAGSRAAAAAGEFGFAVASWVVDSGALDVVGTLSGQDFWLGGALVTTGYAACAASLNFLLRAPRGKHVAIQPAH
jgi:hypothetical protein